MSMVKVKEDLDIVNRRALEQIEEKNIEIERKEKRVREPIEMAWINTCKRFEEVGMPDFGDNDQISVDEHINKFLDSQPSLSSNEAQTREVGNQAVPIVVNDQEPMATFQLNPLAPTYASNEQVHRHTNIQDSTPLNHVNQSSTAIDNNLRNLNLVQTQLTTISKLLEIQNQSRLPLPEPGIFSGDPLQYPVCAKAFKTLIESHAINSVEKLHYLGKYVSGDCRSNYVTQW
ncbi:Hypothetical predicted protein [Paramuricea clavata]|uniref:Uncharacterized protein n=1 Tax=Paramuricea clavata TaxID=317549 RepID=A0A7D9J6Y7_PARCT|nr:Hypothetical predicted protein [Paramuricea clavata]